MIRPEWEFTVISYGAMLGAYANWQDTTLSGCRIQGWTLRPACAIRCKFLMEEFDPGVLPESMGGTPWEIPHVYDELSPTSHVANVKTPVLILHGENDAVQQAATFAVYSIPQRGGGGG